MRKKMFLTVLAVALLAAFTLAQTSRIARTLGEGEEYGVETTQRLQGGVLNNGTDAGNFTLIGDVAFNGDSSGFTWTGDSALVYAVTATGGFFQFLNASGQVVQSNDSSHVSLEIELTYVDAGSLAVLHSRNPLGLFASDFDADDDGTLDDPVWIEDSFDNADLVFIPGNPATGFDTTLTYRFWATPQDFDTLSICATPLMSGSIRSIKIFRHNGGITQVLGLADSSTADIRWSDGTLTTPMMSIETNAAWVHGWTNGGRNIESVRVTKDSVRVGIK